MRPAFVIASVVVHAAAMAAAVAMGAYAARRLPPAPQVTIVSSTPSEPGAAALPPLPDVVVEAEVELPQACELPLAEPWPTAREAAAEALVEAPPRPVPRQPTRERLRAAEVARPEPAAAADEARPFVEAVRCAENEPPRYPEHDRRAGHEGIVVVAATIAADGTVADVALRSASPFPGLNREALRAVRGWRFKPARRDGAPVGSTVDVTIEFRLRAADR